jgi:hypothetical protein
MSTVGRYRGYSFTHCRIRVFLAGAETNPLLWITHTPDRSDVLGWYDTRRAMEADIDAMLDELAEAK